MNRIIIRQHQAAAIIFTLIGAALLLVLIFSAAMSSNAASGTIIYVDKDAPPGGNGQSWATAVQYLQDGLAAAADGDELWIAQGVYYPDEGAGQTAGDIEATFTLVGPSTGLSLYGGFNGTETSRDEADPAKNITVLSGDLDHNDVRDANGITTSYTDIVGSNAIGVVTCNDQAGRFALDGLVITGGSQTQEYSELRGGGATFFRCALDLRRSTVVGNQKGYEIDSYGGGIFFKYADDTATGPTLHVMGSTFRNNYALTAGGGLYVASTRTDHNLAVLVEDTVFEGNYGATPTAGTCFESGGGGGMGVDNANVLIERSIFRGNSSRCRGGGLALAFSGVKTVRDSVFIGNQVLDSGDSTDDVGHGGAINVQRGRLSLSNSLVAGNTAYRDGGGLNLLAISHLDNVTVVDNTAEGRGGGIYHIPSGQVGSAGAAEITNSIVSRNSAGSTGNGIDNGGWPDPGDFARISHSLIQDSGGSGAAWDSNVGVDLGGNIDTVPGFQNVVPDDPEASKYRLLLSSPAIDAGDTAVVALPTDLDGHLRVFNGVVDMGAYETQVVCPTISTSRLYVDSRATGAGLGTSWADALPRLQDSLTLARNCPNNNISEIWVEHGTYYPDKGAYQTEGDRSAAFQLQNGLAIYGGFLGNETDLDQRDPWHLVTVLSGDIDQDDNSDAHDLVETPADIVGNNSFHVVIGSATDSSARLDGFAITGGQANGSAAAKEHEGGGLFAQTGSPALNNLAFVGNIAEEGGGMTLVAGSAPHITNAWFGGNAAGDYGGALHNESSDPTLTNVLMSGNRAAAGGGAIYNLVSSPELNNVTIAGNAAGATVTLAGFEPQAVQVAPRGGGIFNLTGSKPAIRNSIIWNNEDDSGVGTASASIHNQDTGSTPTSDYSDIQGRDSIVGLIFDVLDTIDDDPLFVAPVSPASAPSFGGDYRLKGLSLAIDKGGDSFNSLPTDLNGNPRVQGARIDMGPYEATPTPDISVHKTSDTPTAKVGDVVNYTYEVINTGGLLVTGLTAVDDLLGPITLSSDSLTPGLSATGTISYTVDVSDLPGPIANTATVTGTVGVSTTVVMSDNVTVSLSYRPEIAVSISADKGSALPGDTVTYDYLVTNTGDVELSSVAVNDSRLGAITLDATTLAPGVSASGTDAYLVQDSDLPGPLVNIATASGDSPAGTTVQDQDTAVVGVVIPVQPSDQYLPVVLKFYPPTNTPTITPTPSPTPTNTPSPITCQNIVGNSGFEDFSAWLLETTAYTAAYSTVQQHTGARSVRTGITNQLDDIFSYSSAMQTITIPHDATKAELRYYIYPQTTETMAFVAPENALEIDEKQAGAASDIQLVLVLDLNNNELARLYGDRRNDRTWLLGSNDLLYFKGQTIKLYFGTFNNGRWNQGVTAMYVDDVTLEVCAPN